MGKNSAPRSRVAVRGARKPSRRRPEGLRWYPYTLASALTRLSSYFLPTLKEPPSDAEAISHVLMVRAGLVRQLGAGMWSFLPAGWRVHRRVEQVIREEMDRDRRARVPLPGAPAGRALAAHRPLRDPGALQAEGPLRAPAGPRDDARGGDHLPHLARRALLPRPAADALPLPDQGARRAASARRHPAHARVHHEGRLQLRPRRRGPRALLPAEHPGLRPDLRSLRPALVQGRVRRGDDGRRRRTRVHGAMRGGRERGRALGCRLCRERRGGQGDAAGPDLPAAARRARAGRDSRTRGRSRRCRSCSGSIRPC